MGTHVQHSRGSGTWFAQRTQGHLECMLGALPHASFPGRWSRCVPRELHTLLACTGDSAQYFSGRPRGARHHRLWTFLRDTSSPGFICKSYGSAETETVDGISGGLGGSSVRSHMGQRGIDVGFIRPVTRPMGRHGSGASPPSHLENFYDWRAPPPP